jgi:uncharacterized protein YdaU (DUF1376 family)
VADAAAWMPVYIGDYLGDTQRLTTEQHGAYLLLLFDYWRNGPPPADDAVLSQITRVSRPAWKKMRRTILAFFSERNGHLHHGRVDHELAMARDNYERRSTKAKKAAAARWGDHAPKKAKGNAPSIPQGLLDECPSPSPSVTKVTGGEPPDVIKELFDVGISILKGCGHNEREARSLVGRWRKVHSDGEVLAALIDCRTKAISNPVEWMPKRLSAGATKERNFEDIVLERKGLSCAAKLSS